MDVQTIAIPGPIAPNLKGSPALESLVTVTFLVDIFAFFEKINFVNS